MGTCENEQALQEKGVNKMGGKLTTYRRMAAETVDEALEVLGTRPGPSQTAKALLPGAIGLDPDHDFEALARSLVEASGVSPGVG